MARRGFAILFTLLGSPLFISHGRLRADVRAVRPRTGGAVQRDAGPASRRLAHRARASRRRRLPARVEDADGAVDRRQPAQGQGRSARQGGAAQADRLRVAVLGQGPGGARRGARLPEVGQAGLRLSRIRRRSRVLPRHRGRQSLPDAVDAARPGRRRHLRAVPARHARQDRRHPRSAPHRPVQDGGQHLQGEGLHRGAQGDGRVDEPRSVRPDRARHRRRPEEERGRHPQADRRWSVSAGGRAERRTDRRGRLRGSGRRQAAHRRPAPASRRRRLRAGQPHLARAEQGTAHRGDLRRRHDQQRQERLRPGQRRDRRLRHADRVHPPGAARQLGARDRAARRQPRRIGARRPTRSGAS